MLHVRGVPVWPPHAAEPDEMSVSDWPMIVLPPCAYTLKSIPFVDGEMNFGRRTPLELPRPAVVPPTMTLICTDSAAPAGFDGVTGVGAERPPPPPPPQPAKNAAANVAVSNLRSELVLIRHRQHTGSERTPTSKRRRTQKADEQNCSPDVPLVKTPPAAGPASKPRRTVSGRLRMRASRSGSDENYPIP